MALDRDWFVFAGIYGSILAIMLYSVTCTGCVGLKSPPRGHATIRDHTTMTEFMDDNGKVVQRITKADVKAKSVAAGGSTSPSQITTPAASTNTAGGQKIDYAAINQKAIMTWCGIGLLVGGIVLFAIKMSSAAWAPFLAVIPTSACYGMSGCGGLILLLAMLTGMQSFLIILIGLGAGGLLAFSSGALSNLFQTKELVKAKNGGGNGVPSG
jgi:hypothetical protein